VTEPLAIDLCCGLTQSELHLVADASVKQLVARRTEHPKHVPERVADQRPSSVPRELGLVRDFQDSIFAAAFASRGNVRISTAHPVELRIPVRTVRIVTTLTRWIASSPNSSEFARRLASARHRAIALIRARWRDAEMLSAARAVSSSSCDIGLLSSSAAARAPNTARRAIQLVRPYGPKLCGAFPTGQIVHSGAVA
jgi:hypothetical protein